jgi:uncharacterized protein (AIM24 family)
VQEGFVIQHEIIGDDMQAVIITMAQGEQIRAEAGAMLLGGLGDLIGGDR